MRHQSTLLRGTLILTTAGILSRIMGFFYRIFLANTIGAEGMGIYQMIFPIYSVCFSLCASGIETAISKLTAGKCATGKSQEAYEILYTGLFLTLTLSLACSFFIYQFAEKISVIFLHESRCTQLLKILALTVPFGTTQSCICGHYFGMRKTMVPSCAQLIEQILRIFCVLTISRIYIVNGMKISPVIAVIGLVFGEFCSLLFTITCFSFRSHSKLFQPLKKTFSHFKEILPLSTPLTASRICVNLLVSLEAAMIPNALKSYGMNTSLALSVYGILNGMALPFILFPNALTGSISMMLLPTVSESQAEGSLKGLKYTLTKTFSFCIILGIVCLFFFLLFGKFLGNFVFSNDLAGKFLQTLSWICPFLYLNTTLSSVLNGLGKTSITFFTGISSLLIRIAFIFFIIPKLGIFGYLIALLVSQLYVTVITLFFLSQYFKFDHC